MTIRKAVASDIDDVARSYEALFDYFDSHRDRTHWLRGTYPTRAVAEKGASEGWLYVLRDEDGTLLASMLLNHNQDAEYALQPWRYAADPGQVLVLHTLCVLPGHSHRGIGRKMVQFAQDLARSRGCTVMRFDTNIDNIPASHLYENMGFELVSTGKAMLNGILPVTLRYYEKKLD